MTPCLYRAGLPPCRTCSTVLEVVRIPLDPSFRLTNRFLFKGKLLSRNLQCRYKGDNERWEIGGPERGQESHGWWSCRVGRGPADGERCVRARNRHFCSVGRTTGREKKPVPITKDEDGGFWVGRGREGGGWDTGSPRRFFRDREAQFRPSFQCQHPSARRLRHESLSRRYRA